MKRLSIVALAAGAMALTLAGCGSDKSSDANGPKQSGTTTAARTASAVASTTVAAPVQPPAEAPTRATAAKKTSAPAGAQTTCGDFRDLTEDAEKQVIDQVLAANPGSFLDGSPNVALGTAKLACLSSGYTNTPVAVAIRVAPK
ncbi:hypothetical protein [Nocardia aurantiaca]|uniref:DUF732 domain-containing protein n=1 Tax=Nocardia aurantiaca TaxID=2675850 RepID=A0A6I3L2S5_9NOCA|nr:hypothetical protein [Nocardia aurantiaca]MTE14934.1 hypothetical protein [Nocardia aurantiaca]